ncbi:MAG: M24 family metallopeptidase [Fimbriimonas sp.]
MAGTGGLSRVARLGEALSLAGVDAFIGHYPVTMDYLHGFGEHAGERFLALAVSATGEVRLIAPALSEAQARRVGISDVRPWKDGEDPIPLFEELANDWGLRSGIIAVDPTLPARQLLKMQNTLPAALFRDGEEIISSLMRVKGEDELDRMRRAAKIADDAYAAILPQLRAGMTELQVERLVKDAMAERGGKPTFCIIATGANAAEPHHLSDDTVIGHGDLLLLDFGCEVEGYQSDITRVCAIGTASDRGRELYSLVHRAHLAGRAAVRPGVTGAEVDAACRKVIEDAGHGPAFFHRTGHGIGMNGHESPNITMDNHEPLEVGNCFSIEPGVYYAGDIGIRIETIVAVTADGHENLNEEANPELVVVG